MVCWDVIYLFSDWGHFTKIPKLLPFFLVSKYNDNLLRFLWFSRLIEHVRSDLSNPAVFKLDARLSKNSIIMAWILPFFCVELLQFSLMCWRPIDRYRISVSFHVELCISSEVTCHFANMVMRRQDCTWKQYEETVRIVQMMAAIKCVFFSVYLTTDAQGLNNQQNIKNITYI